MSNSNSSKQILLSVIGVAVLVIAVVGVAFAFFNYTRTGSANIIKTGRIAFNSTQGTSMNLNNLFPIDPEETGIMNDATKVGTVTINVTGDTDYSGGIEYLVSAVNVQNIVGSGNNAKALPISIAVSVTSNTENDPATTLGTSDDSYFTNRETTNTSIYKVLAGDVIENNEELLVGYIKSGATGVDGNIVIKAYIDENEVAITDTYPEGTIDTVIITGYSSNACETALTGTGVTAQTAAMYCATANSLQSVINDTTGYNKLTTAQIAALVTAGIVEEYTDGTTSEWVGDRTRFTTEEWNSLQANGVSFQVKVEANQGIWVEEPVDPTISNCPGPQCAYTKDYNTINSTITGTYTIGDYSDYGSYFIGHALEGTTIKESYLCIVMDDTPYCIRGGVDESLLSRKPIYKDNLNNKLLPATGEASGECEIDASRIENGCGGYFDSLNFGFSISVSNTGRIQSSIENGDSCGVYTTGESACWEP